MIAALFLGVMSTFDPAPSAFVINELCWLVRAVVVKARWYGSSFHRVWVCACVALNPQLPQT